MPCIQTKVNVKITEEQEANLKSAFGKAISLIPGKSESWLMLTFDDESTVYFRGDGASPAAFVQVSIFGKAKDGDYDKLTVAITQILKEELEISTDRIYVKYEESSHWGWNGNNF